MESMSIISLVTPFLIELAKKGIEKATETTAEKMTEGTISWVKKLFFKDEKPIKLLTDLEQDPDSPENQVAVQDLINESTENNLENQKHWGEFQKFVNIYNNGAEIGQQNIYSTVINNNTTFNM